MKEMRNILGWLGMAQEHNMVDDAQKHVEETFKTVTYFVEAVQAFIRQDLAAKTQAIESVRESEHRADVIMSKLISVLSEGLLLPPDREDLMHAIKSLDRIADWTNGSARLLGYIEHKLPDNVLKHISLSADLILSSMTKMKSAISALTKTDLKTALLDCEEIDRYEHEADDAKKFLIEALIHSKLEPVTFFLCYQLADYMEGVTDKISDAADFVKVIAIRSK